jgi:hypothetical protein
MSLHPQYITNKKGKKTAVILSVKEYQHVIEELEELNDLRLYDEGKLCEEPPISLNEYVKKRKARKKNG